MHKLLSHVHVIFALCDTSTHENLHPTYKFIIHIKFFICLIAAPLLERTMNMPESRVHLLALSVRL